MTYSDFFAILCLNFWGSLKITLFFFIFIRQPGLSGVCGGRTAPTNTRKTSKSINPKKSKFLFKPIHKAATAYRSGVSIKDHAAVHADNHYLLKLDFQDFFPSILGTHFLMHLKSHTNISDDDANLLMRLLFRFDRESQDYVLSIGAPSSPAVSNTVMYDFDNKLTDYCRTHDIIYSRYADDLALSTSKPKVLNDAFDFVRRLCGDMPYPRLQLNDAKTVFTSKKHRRQLTGLVLTNDGKPSLGREKKRLIRSMAHHFFLGELSQDQIMHLRGLLAFAYSIEPLFYGSINRMIGEEAFQRLMKG